jgi:hypothetical protein
MNFFGLWTKRNVNFAKYLLIDALDPILIYLTTSKLTLLVKQLTS